MNFSRIIAKYCCFRGGNYYDNRFKYILMHLDAIIGIIEEIILAWVWSKTAKKASGVELTDRTYLFTVTSGPPSSLFKTFDACKLLLHKMYININHINNELFKMLSPLSTR